MVATLQSLKLTSALRSLLFPTSSLMASGHPLYNETQHNLQDPYFFNHLIIQICMHYNM